VSADVTARGVVLFIAKALAVSGPEAGFEPYELKRRDVRSNDVRIRISYCGVCQSDIAHARSSWGMSTFYPLVPGHEITGVVTEVGSDVTGFSVGDRVGVGALVNSCHTCDSCTRGFENQCLKMVRTYNQIDFDGKPTQGGYSDQIVVDEAFVLRIPDGLALDVAAPLLCAGVTVYAPMKRLSVGPGTRLAVIGLGGLGHMAVQIGAALGAEVTVIDLDPEKEHDSRRLGAHDFMGGLTPESMEKYESTFNVVISTAPPGIDMNFHMRLLGLEGVWVALGLGDAPITVAPFSVMTNHRSITGGRVGGIEETQEMLDFCAEHGIGSEIELINTDSIDSAFERLLRGDVRFRFVMDMETLS
jgi:uncharacterized zinc-type alcohol dehydrogenase-like protein